VGAEVERIQGFCRYFAERCRYWDRTPASDCCSESRDCSEASRRPNVLIERYFLCGLCGWVPFASVCALFSWSKVSFGIGVNFVYACAVPAVSARVRSRTVALSVRRYQNYLADRHLPADLHESSREAAESRHPADRGDGIHTRLQLGIGRCAIQSQPPGSASSAAI